MTHLKICGCHRLLKKWVYKSVYRLPRRKRITIPLADGFALGIAVDSPQRGTSEDLERKARPDLRRVTPKKK